MVNYKAIFFDWGGVIGSDPGGNFLEALLLKLGANQDQANEIFNTYKISFMKGQLSEAEYWQALRDNYNLVIHDSISEEFNNWRGLLANQGILSLAKAAQEKGLKIAILSNVIEPTYNVIKEAGYYDLFDEVIASCKVGFAKPEEEIYKIALARLGVTAKESIFIDDQTKCTIPAEALGFKTILFNNQEQLTEELSKLIDL
jgi:epoxide hydrolase-like predicted phosphatase